MRLKVLLLNNGVKADIRSPSTIKDMSNIGYLATMLRCELFLSLEEMETLTVLRDKRNVTNLVSPQLLQSSSSNYPVSKKSQHNGSFNFKVDSQIVGLTQTATSLHQQVSSTHLCTLLASSKLIINWSQSVHPLAMTISVTNVTVIHLNSTISIRRKFGTFLSLIWRLTTLTSVCNCS